MKYTKADFLNYYPEFSLEIKENRTFINRFLNSNLELNEAKCLNPNCNSFVKWSIGYGFKKCCSTECELIMKEDLKLIGNLKRIQTTTKKYGVSFISQLESTQEKIKKTCLLNFGVDNPSKSDKIQIDKKINSFSNYGTEYPIMSQAVKDRIRSKIQERRESGFKFNEHHTKDHLEHYELWYDKEFWELNFIIEGRFYLKKCIEFFNCNQSTAHKQLKQLNIKVTQYYNSSLAEDEISKELLKYNLDIITGTRNIIKPYELDIYIPDKQIAIEYNGIYWHSYRGINKYSSDKQTDIRYCKTRHLLKTEACQKQGIQLFHIFENEWQHPVKQEIWKSVLENALGKSIRLGARKCSIQMVPKKDIRPFLEQNHLQGYGVSPIAYGLYYNNEIGQPELMSMMTFTSSKGRMDTKTDWELVRFCNKRGYNVQGAASRLLKAFRAEHPGSIKSYANRRWSNGNLYRQLGFRETGISGPNHFYWQNSDPYTLLPRQLFQKHKLKNVLKIFDENLTAFENVINNNYNFIWDSGNYTFVLE